MFLYVLVLLLPCAYAGAGGAPRNVVVVENSMSAISQDIADYYSAARSIPSGNRCRIRCSTSEVVTQAECETNVVAPILQFVRNSAIADHIDYIVLTKGVPLAADYGYSTGPLSVSSILACAGESSISGPTENPYGPLSSSPEIAFSHQLSLNGHHIYLVTRLDGYTVEDVHALIDRSKSVSTPAGPVLLDLEYLGADAASSNTMLNQRLRDADTLLVGRGIPTIFDDTSLFIGGQKDLMGYFSWGSNDTSFTRAAYLSNTFAPGSVADSYVSTSGRTFSPTSGGQSLVADLIAQGASGVCGYVSEPYVAYTTYPDILFDRYTKGFNLAESFYAACPMLFWKSVVIGDPILAPYATPPQVKIETSGEPLTGLDHLSATATDPDGIAGVDFFLDGNPVGSCSTSPYSVAVDTTLYPVGTHAIMAMARESSKVGAEGWAVCSVEIVNPVSALRCIADAFGCPDGQGVKCSGQAVSAATSDMGGSEFYMQETNGASGIRVISDMQVAEGDVVTIIGTMMTDCGERCILAGSVDVTSRLLTLLSPRGMPNRSVGGGDFCCATKGVTGGVGLRNIGLLIRTWGRATYIGGDDENYFYIDDGSHLKDGSGHVGLRVDCRSLSKPTLGGFVAVTGVCGCEELTGKIIPVVKARKQSDIE